MALPDKKESELSLATTPLTGTETVTGLQNGANVNFAIDDLQSAAGSTPTGAVPVGSVLTGNWDGAGPQLKTSGVALGTYGAAGGTAYPRIHVMADGRIDAVVEVAVAGVVGTSTPYDVYPGQAGVIGTNVSGNNDTAAIQAIINAKAGGKVRVGPGTYMVVGLTVLTDTTIEGSTGAIFKKRSNGDLFSSMGARATLLGITVDGNTGAGWTGSGVFCDSVADVVFSRCRFINTYRSGSGQGAIVMYSCARPIIDNCKIDGTVFTKNTINGVIQACDIVGGGATSTVAVVTQNPGGAACDGWRIIGNRIVLDSGNDLAAIQFQQQEWATLPNSRKHMVVGNRIIITGGTQLGHITAANVDESTYAGNTFECTGGTYAYALELGGHYNAVGPNVFDMGDVDNAKGIIVRGDKNSIDGPTFFNLGEGTGGEFCVAILCLARGSENFGTPWRSASRNVIANVNIDIPSNHAAVGVMCLAQDTGGKTNDNKITATVTGSGGNTGQAFRVQTDGSTDEALRNDFNGCHADSIGNGWLFAPNTAASMADMILQNNVATNIPAGHRVYLLANPNTPNFQNNSWDFQPITAAPSNAEFYAVGEIVRRAVPASGAAVAWYCTVAGGGAGAVPGASPTFVALTLN